MRSVSWVVGSLVVGMLGVGCGGLCDRYESVGEDFEDKIRDCDFTTDILVDFNKNECKEDLEECTAADQDELDKWLDCLDKLPECKSSSRDSWKLQADACILDADKITAACLASLSGE